MTSSSKNVIKHANTRGGTFGKRGSKRTAPQREADLVLEASLYLEGFTQKEITDHICDIRPYNITAQQVCQDMQKVRDRWLDSQIRDFDAAKAMELSRIDKLEREYWEAWRHSLEKAEEIQSEKEQQSIMSATPGTGTGAGTPTFSKEKVKKKETETFGEPRYLEGIRWCIDKRCKIFGLDAPSKVNINWRDEARMAGVDPDQFENKLVKEFVAAAQKKGNGDNE